MNSIMSAFYLHFILAALLGVILIAVFSIIACDDSKNTQPEKKSELKDRQSTLPPDQQDEED